MRGVGPSLSMFERVVSRSAHAWQAQPRTLASLRPAIERNYSFSSTEVTRNFKYCLGGWQQGTSGGSRPVVLVSAASAELPAQPLALQGGSRVGARGMYSHIGGASLHHSPASALSLDIC